MSILEKISKLTKNLYPNGRAFGLFDGAVLSEFNEAIAQKESEVYQDALSILDSALPDNENFTSDDAEDWERRLGLITNDLVSLEDRKLAIARKMNFPGNVNARQASSWIEYQLRLAGFDVFVHENFNGTDPGDLFAGDFVDNIEHGTFDHGEFEHGGLYNNICANSINAEDDYYFDWGSNLKCSFFVCGENIGDIANVDADREQEFRQIILKTKPVQTIAFLMVNYT
jgi:uncharacterized protein YmfQ (DUF2313 family)